MACGILVPRPGMEAVPPAVEAWSLNHWTTREVPQYFKYCFVKVDHLMGTINSCIKGATWRLSKESNIIITGN